MAPVHVTVGITTAIKDNQEASTEQINHKFGVRIRRLLTKFWIWVITITLFTIGITGTKMTLFRILYTALALIFVITFQLSWVIWRKIIYGFWLTAIIISIMILILTCTFQFNKIPDLWKSIGVVDQWQAYIGLEKKGIGDLFFLLIITTFFVIVTVIQLKYFHKDFLLITDIRRRGTNTTRPSIMSDNEYETQTEEVSSKTDSTPPNVLRPESNASNFKAPKTSDQFKLLMKNSIEVIWLFMELHIKKFIFLLVMVVSLSEVNVIHLGFVIGSVLAMMLSSNFQDVVLKLMSVSAAVMLLAEMIFQIDHFKVQQWVVNCTIRVENGTDIASLNGSGWLGLYKVGNNTTMLQLLSGYIWIILAVTIYVVVVTRQKYMRHLKGRPLSRSRILFPRVSYKDANKGVLHCVKYLFNYGFYRFGVEITFISIVLLIGNRLNICALVYSIWLLLFIVCSRNTLSKIWYFFNWFVAATIPLQYVLIVGPPPEFCFGLYNREDRIIRNALQWMYYPILNAKPEARKLIWDFIVLLLVTRQTKVFRIEYQHNIENDYPGGSNKCIIHEVENPSYENPVPDFISDKRSYLDSFMHGILCSLLWISCAVVFFAGTRSVTLFSFGYIIGSFLILWQGNDFYLRPISTILKSWNRLLIYNVSVIFFKVFFQILGCIFIEEMKINVCWIIRVFGIACINNFSSPDSLQGALSSNNGSCRFKEDPRGLGWDALCFILLVFQKRLFSSHYFGRIVDDAKAVTMLATRGAELIEELSEKQIREQQKSENAILLNIKNKMDRIREVQKKNQGTKSKEPRTHQEAVRSGDYYMFADEEQQILTELEYEEYKNEESDERPEKNLKRNLTVRQNKKESGRKRLDDRDDGKYTESYDGTLISTDKYSNTNLNCWDSFIMYLKFALALLNGCMFSIMRFLNKKSRDYRYVIQVLEKEKKTLKETKNLRIGMRMLPDMRWQPVPIGLTSERQKSPLKIENFENQNFSASTQPVFVRLMLAVHHMLMSRSDMVCYFAVFLLQIKSPTLVSLPLPLMVFFWGTLSIPRPTKRFWVTIIAYTEFIVVVKNICKSEMFSLIRETSTANANPLSWSNLLGLSANTDDAFYDLVLLLTLFFHRSTLKSLGLWKSTEEFEKANKGSSIISTSGKDVIMEMTSVNLVTQKSHTSGDILGQSTDSYQNAPLCSGTLKEIGNSLTSEKNLFSPHFKLLDSKDRLADDVYAYMFFCDFCNIIVIIFGFSAFQSLKSDAGVVEYIEEGKIPFTFLAMLILQFSFIIIDRWLYLSKYICGKLVLQHLLVVGVHIWMFFVLPSVTERPFTADLSPSLWYLIKCCYLLLSAYQIRSGYPTTILGNFLCKNYNLLNMVLFKVFTLIPFMYELRTLMDWIWTETSMTLADWITVEDIFRKIFQQKCKLTRETDKKCQLPRSQKIVAKTKFLYGGGGLIILFTLIWFPLVLFALGNTVKQPNIPYDMEAKIQVSSYQSIYSSSASKINYLTGDQWHQMLKIYGNSEAAQMFLSEYSSEDVGAVFLPHYPSSTWTIPPPEKFDMEKALDECNNIKVTMEWKLNRKSENTENPKSVTDKNSIILDEDECSQFLSVLQSKNGTNVRIHQLMPKFLKITNGGKAQPVEKLMSVTRDSNSDESTKKHPIPYVNLTLQIEKANNSVSIWWNVFENESSSAFQFLNEIDNITRDGSDSKSLIIYTFNDKMFNPGLLAIISGKGIIGLYATFIVVVGAYVKNYFTGMSSQIMFENMPYVDRILQLCLDIFLVRECKEFDFEEILFAKLLFLYRSPETIIEWTRPPVDDGLEKY